MRGQVDDSMKTNRRELSPGLATPGGACLGEVLTALFRGVQHLF
jgi:hypothetical protein